MFDMAKKVQKKGNEHLLPGEQVLAASVVTRPGQLKKSAAFGAIGGAVGLAVGQALSGKQDETASGTMADAIPAISQSILAVTNQRWILFDQSSLSGGPKSVTCYWSHDQLVGITLDSGKIMSKITLQFSDGSETHLEAVKSAKPQKLAEAAATLPRR